MDLLEYGAQLLSEKLGADLDPAAIGNALSGLLANDAGEFDLGALAGKFAGSGELGGLLSSWLGDGENSPLSPEALTSILGGDRIAEFASSLGVDAGSAAGSLAEVLPEMHGQGQQRWQPAGHGRRCSTVCIGAAKSLFS
jgi:uncharacterized protein YidB (DUF937 family)